MTKTWNAAIAEAVGTFALCFIGAGSICINQWTGGELGLLGIAIAHGAVLAVMISTLGHISGGHFNPAVTFGLLTAKKIDSKKAVAYILAQLAGGVFAGYLLTHIIPASVWQPVNLGTPGLGDGITVSQAILVETVLTFFLVLGVFGTAVDTKGSWNAVAGFGIGTVLVFDILFGGPLTGASMNPARTFGPAFAAGFWEHHIVYWVGPLLGGALAATLYTNVLTKKH